MDDQLRPILERMTAELSAWLEQPGEASKKLAALRTQIDELKGEIGTDGLADALKGLQQAERTVDRQRQREAALAIAQLYIDYVDIPTQSVVYLECRRVLRP